MKTIVFCISKGVFLLSFGLIIYSCVEKNESVSSTDLALGEVVNDTLNADQIFKIKEIHNTFVEIDSFSLEKTINDFKRDRNPDNEIAVWLSMAKAYKKFTSNRQNLSLNKKKEVYRLILMRSMENETIAKEKSELKLLSDKEVREIFAYYDLEAIPISIQQR